jgi:hypothetical protein
MSYFVLAVLAVYFLGCAVSWPIFTRAFRRDVTDHDAHLIGALWAMRWPRVAVALARDTPEENTDA